MTDPNTLDGTYNFRDIGGLPLTDGGSTRSGVLYRSDALHGLTPTGEQTLAGSDIGTIVDFRTEAERLIGRDKLPHRHHIRVVHLPLLEGAMSHMIEEALAARVLGDRFAAGRAAEEALAHLPSLGQLYTSMLEHGAASFAQVARIVATEPEGPRGGVLIHCTAGKDRTGVCTALLLDAVGVQRDAIIADYAVSQQNLSGAWLTHMEGMVRKLGVTITPGMAEIMGGTPPAAIEQAFAWVDGRGGASAYLAAGSLTDDELAALRMRLRA